MAAITDGNIRLLAKHEIDPERWNACVERNQGLIYNLYEYLTILSDDWNGIVVDDYGCVLPIPWKRKLGVRYIPVVPFVQQLSLLGDCTIREKERISAMVDRFAHYGDYSLSTELPFTTYTLKDRTNFCLNLNVAYATIRNNYSENLKRNIRKASNAQLSLDTCSCRYALDAYSKTYRDKVGVVKTVYYESFRRLVGILEKQGFVVAYSARKEDVVLATALFLQHNNRLYNILPCTLGEGKKYAAMHFLLDQVVQLHAGSNMVLDFEGSDLEGVRQFYEQFHPTCQTYFQYHLNTLPFPLNKLKR